MDDGADEDADSGAADDATDKDTADEHTTRLLNRLSKGDSSVSNELMERIYSELRSLAEAHMAREAADHTLQPTALVHEVFLRLVEPGKTSGASWQSQGHFYSMASKVMRSLLVDHARRKKTEKRGGDRIRVPLEERTPSEEESGADGLPGYDVLDVNEAMEHLAEVDARLVEVVELRYFGGLTVPRIAETLETSTRTVERRLRTASAWLRRELD